jgi:hypothetical protein
VLDDQYHGAAEPVRQRRRGDQKLSAERLHTAIVALL